MTWSHLEIIPSWASPLLYEKPYLLVFCNDELNVQNVTDVHSTEIIWLLVVILLSNYRCKFVSVCDCVKVGAAISMTYITGQPIVFVGTGQTYTDLKNLNAKAVVHALMK